MVTFSERTPGIPVAKISNQEATAEISLYGAHVLSYCPANIGETLFVSSKSAWESGKPVRGGIPVCWPWFGPHVDNPTLPQHGFLRLMLWSLASIEETEAATTLTLEIRSTPETRALWPHDFKVSLAITVGSRLEMKLTTANTGTDAFSITDALHTYFGVTDIAGVSLTGLEDLDYMDKVGGLTKRTQAGTILIGGEVNRVYINASSCAISDAGNRRKVTVSQTGFSDIIVWNPWTDVSKAMADFGDEEYHRMVCAESGSVLGNAVSVGSGKSVTQLMTLTASEGS